MTLIQVIKAMEAAAMMQPTINMIVRSDIYRINASPERRYGVFSWVQNQHSMPETPDFIRFSFSLFYVDRLTENKKNETEVQSVGIQTLSNIIGLLEEKGLSGQRPVTFDTFTERFTDDCAGVFCYISFLVSVDSMCAEDFADFNNDYNDDFLIF